jgi:hypothetical protein
MAQPVLGQPAVDDIYQIHIKATLYDQTIRMVLHYRLKEVGSGIDADRWAFYNTIFQKLDFAGGLLAAYRAATTTDLLFEYVRIQKVFATREVFRHFDYLFSGGVVGAAAPANVAMAINKRTGKVGRRGHGTTHLAGLPVSLITNSVWDVGSWGDAEAFAWKLDDELSGTSGEYTLVPCLAPDDDEDPHFPADIVQSSPSQEIRTMYRRTKGIGE